MSKLLSRRRFGGLAVTALAMPTDAAGERMVKIPASGGDFDDVAIQRALDRGATTVLLTSTAYRISTTIVVRAGQTLAAKGATISAAQSPTGQLRDIGTHVAMTDFCVLRDVHIVVEAGDASFVANRTSSVIRMEGSGSRIERTKVTVRPGRTATYSPVAITVWGVGVVDNVIQDCHFTGCGLYYSFGSAQRTIVRRCVFLRAPQNALTGLCTVTSLAAEGHVIDGNTILYPGRMGIEDFSRIQDVPAKVIRGSHIVNNRIVSEATGRPMPEYFAISAVGLDSVIEGNCIENWPTAFCIEVGGGRGALIRRNQCLWTDGNPNRVVAVQVQEPEYSGRQLVHVTANRFVRPFKALQSRGQAVLFSDNVVTDPIRSIVDYDRPAGTAMIYDNIVTVDSSRPPDVADRILFFVPGRTDMRRNRITYRANALALTHDYGIFAGGDGSIFDGNSFTVDGRAVPGTGVIALSTNGMRPTGVRVSGTRSKGPVRADYSNMPGLQEPVANQWSGGVIGKARLGR
ncbi:hypothetical protein [Sphingomonas sp. Leaf4]|uniref:hypothetical protein n=1 Tax=Sphingomonas sp. Leaf4 TaxID=2876553 RepID=UPI001E37C519|nr:hypothetical protein [Sphingomonas sp. Leaf4]